jgi:hypothetical protein
VVSRVRWCYFHTDSNFDTNFCWNSDLNTNSFRHRDLNTYEYSDAHWYRNCNANSSPDGDSDPWTNSNSDAKTNVYAHENSDIHVHAHENSDIHVHAHENSDIHVHVHESAGGYSYFDCYPNPHSDTHRYLECKLEIYERPAVYLRCEYT